MKDAIGQFCEIPQIDFDIEGKPDIPVYNPNPLGGQEPSTVPSAPRPVGNPSYNPFTTASQKKAANGWEQLYEGLDHSHPMLFEDQPDHEDSPRNATL